MRRTKTVSPPGVTISTGAPVQAELAGRALDDAEATREVSSG